MHRSGRINRLYRVIHIALYLDDLGHGACPEVRRGNFVPRFIMLDLAFVVRNESTDKIDKILIVGRRLRRGRPCPGRGATECKYKVIHPVRVQETYIGIELAEIINTAGGFEVAPASGGGKIPYPKRSE